MYTCFVCGSKVMSTTKPCPNCGYKVEVDDITTCPNRVGATCSIIDELCTYGVGYMQCPIKAQAERDSAF